MQYETQVDAANHCETVAPTGQPGHKSPRPVGNKTAKATDLRKYGLAEMLEDQLSQNWTINKRNCVVMEQQMEMQKVAKEKTVGDAARIVFRDPFVYS